MPSVVIEKPSKFDNTAISASSGSFSTSSGTYVAVTNFSETFKTNGFVRVQLVMDGTTSEGNITHLATGGSQAARLQLKRDSTVVGQVNLINHGNATASWGPGTCAWIDEPAAGSYTYSIEAKIIGGSSMQVNNLKMVVWEGP